MTFKTLYRETLPGGWNRSLPLRRGQSLRLTDPLGGACVALLAYNPHETSERYNLPDTLKAQFTAQITRGHALYSDMGRVLLSVLEDTFGGHDPFGGTLSQEALETRFGTKTYQDHRNDYHRSGRHALQVELAKYRLDDRDLVPNVNFFARTTVDDAGGLVFVPTTQPGAAVLLQAEMDVLVVFAATQHPLDPRAEWAPRPVDFELLQTDVAPRANPVYAHSDQNRRGLANTALYQGLTPDFGALS